MNGQGPYYDEKTALLMKRRKELLAIRSRDVGDNMKWIFWLTIISTLANFFVTMEAMLIVFGVIRYGNFMEISAIAATVVVVLCAVFYAVKLLALKCHSESFYYAGILYGICQLMSMAKNSIEDYSAMALVSIVYAVLQILQLRFFVDGATSSLKEVNRNVELGWISFWKLYVKVLYAMILSAVCIFVPIINLIAVLALAIIGVISVVLAIWQIILIWQTGVALQNFASLNMG